MPDVLGRQRARYANKVVAVLGAGHSAVGTILDLARLKPAEPQTQIVWLLEAITQKSRLAAAPMTSWLRAANSARFLPSSSTVVRSR
jgi:hypothetical protein